MKTEDIAKRADEIINETYTALQIVKGDMVEIYRDAWTQARDELQKKEKGSMVSRYYVAYKIKGFWTVSDNMFESMDDFFEKTGRPRNTTKAQIIEASKETE